MTSVLLECSRYLSLELKYKQHIHALIDPKQLPSVTVKVSIVVTTHPLGYSLPDQHDGLWCLYAVLLYLHASKLQVLQLERI